MKLKLNGEDREFPELAGGATLEQFLQHIELHPGRIAVERNGDIVPRAQWSSIILAEGDKLEVVHFVGGGSS